MKKALVISAKAVGVIAMAFIGFCLFIIKLILAVAGIQSSQWQMSSNDFDAWRNTHSCGFWQPLNQPNADDAMPEQG